MENNNENLGQEIVNFENENQINFGENPLFSEENTDYISNLELDEELRLNAEKGGFPSVYPFPENGDFDLEDSLEVLSREESDKYREIFMSYLVSHDKLFTVVDFIPEITSNISLIVINEDTNTEFKVNIDSKSANVEIDEISLSEDVFNYYTKANNLDVISIDTSSFEDSEQNENSQLKLYTKSFFNESMSENITDCVDMIMDIVNNYV